MNKVNIAVVTFLTAVLASPTVWAITDIFRDEHGKTNWQYVANWTSGSLIIILAFVVISLVVAKRRLGQRNLQLREIKWQLEDRVRERTAGLDESNQKLLQSNTLLEHEIAKHVETTQRLAQSEHYIKGILASMPLVLVSLDNKGNVTQWNRQAEEVSGVAETSAIGRNLWEVYPELVLTWEQVQQVMAQGKTYTYSHRQRGMYYYDITLYPLHSDGQQGVVILVNDISKQKHAEDMLAHNDKISSMTEMASAMAHDINTPLQGMLLDLQSFQLLLQRQSEGVNVQQSDVAKLDQLLADASARGEKVSSIVDNLLTFARGRTQDKQTASVEDLIEGALMLASQMLVLPGELSFDAVTVERDIERNLPVLPCYKTELQQVFLNLIRQACYAFEKAIINQQQAKISIEAHAEIDSIWISLSHNGQVLSEQEQVNIFESSLSIDAQQESSDSSQRLSFSHFIVSEQHQGMMAVTSDIENGTSYHIQLPL
ncbi:MAG: two-component system sensor histidine kinase NtrB [Pseudomonadales bacterium]